MIKALKKDNEKLLKQIEVYKGNYRMKDTEDLISECKQNAILRKSKSVAMSRFHTSSHATSNINLRDKSEDRNSQTEFNSKD